MNRKTHITGDEIEAGRPGGKSLQESYENMDKCDKKKILNQLYHERNLTQEEVGDIIGYSQTGVSGLLRRFDMETKDKRDYTLLKPAMFYTGTKGYERAASQLNGREDRFYIHRLCAVAWYGIKEVYGNDVHHKNNISWDNREENIDIMNQSDHMSQHALEHHKNRSRNSDGTFK